MIKLVMAWSTIEWSLKNDLILIAAGFVTGVALAWQAGGDWMIGGILGAAFVIPLSKWIRPEAKQPIHRANHIGDNGNLER